MAESVNRKLPLREVGSLKPSQVKPMTYRIDTFRALALCSALLEQGNDWSVSGYCDWVANEVMVPADDPISLWCITIKRTLSQSALNMA